MEYLVLVLGLGFAGFIFYIGNCVGHDPPAPSDLDHQACMQMRESGWTEGEIKTFMQEHNSYYFEA
jgi:hypothetical protein